MFKGDILSKIHFSHDSCIQTDMFHRNNSGNKNEESLEHNM